MILILETRDVSPALIFKLNKTNESFLGEISSAFKTKSSYSIHFISFINLSSFGLKIIALKIVRTKYQLIDVRTASEGVEKNRRS